MLNLSIVTTQDRSPSPRRLLHNPFKSHHRHGLTISRPQSCTNTIRRKTSVELIADQYQAFLEARDARDELESLDQDDHDEEDEHYQYSHEPIYQLPILQPTRYDPKQPSSPTALSSPISTASSHTLVDFEAVASNEDAIYFKPVPFTPTDWSQSPTSPYSKAPPSPPVTNIQQPRFSLFISDYADTPGPPLTTLNLERSRSCEGSRPSPQPYEQVRKSSIGSLAVPEPHHVRATFDHWLSALPTLKRPVSRGRQFEKHESFPSRTQYRGRVEHARSSSQGML